MQQDEDPRPIRGGAFDYRGAAIPEYAPEHDAEPDPGEVVWAWVPFEEDLSRGKDRPLAVVGRAIDKPGELVCFLLSSKDRTDDDDWVLIGSGAWDERAPALLGEHLPPAGRAPTSPCAGRAENSPASSSTRWSTPPGRSSRGIARSGALRTGRARA